MTEKQTLEYHNRVISFIRDCGSQIVWVPDTGSNPPRILVLNAYRGYVVPAEMAVYLPPRCSRSVHPWGFFFSPDINMTTDTVLVPWVERTELLYNKKQKMIVFQLAEGEHNTLRFVPKIRSDWCNPIKKHIKHWVLHHSNIICYDKDMQPLGIIACSKSTPITP